VSSDDKSVIDEFHQVVNMTPKQLESWLDTDESKSVGQKNGDDESIGHKSGRYIIELLNKKKDDYTDDDLSHRRLLVTSTATVHNDRRWCRTLALVLLFEKLGHDPLK